MFLQPLGLLVVSVVGCMLVIMLSNPPLNYTVLLLQVSALYICTGCSTKDLLHENTQLPSSPQNQELPPLYTTFMGFSVSYMYLHGNSIFKQK